MMTQRQKDILDALRQLGGKATVRAIAKRAGAPVTDVQKCLVDLTTDHVEHVQGEGYDAEYRRTSPSTP
jgi:DNA-binding IclR family transcriptional regulator